MSEEVLEASEKSPLTFAKVGECLYRNTASGIYYGLVKRNGKQFRKSFKTKDRQLANRRLAKFRQKLGITPRSKDLARIKFDGLCKLWLPTATLGLKPKSKLRREVVVKQLKRFFGGMLVRNIRRSDCDAWAAERAGKRAASTYNNEKEVLNAILSYAQREGIILDNPASHLPRRKNKSKVPDIPTREQFRQLIEAMRKLDARAKAGADLVELLAYSGMRLGEATALKWADVKFGRGSFIVTGGEDGTKNYETRVVPLFPVLKRLLQRLKAEAKPDADFVVSTAKATKAMTTASKKAGIPVFTHHSMRHFFASNAIEAGIDFKVIASWLGHKDGGVLVAKTYGHLRDAHSFEMAKKMDF